MGKNGQRRPLILSALNRQILVALAAAVTSLAAGAAEPSARDETDVTEIDLGLQTILEAGTATAALEGGPYLAAGPIALQRLPVCDEPIRDAIRAQLRAAPRKGSEGYVLLRSLEVQAALRNVIVELENGAPEEAMGHARRAGYRLCRAGDDSWAVLIAPLVTDGRAIAVWRAAPARPVVLEAPHPFNEAGTLDQAEGLFERLRARGLIVSGTHRCASSKPSGCSGTTFVCGGKLEPYPESDPGHAVPSAFQTIHETLADLYPQLLMVSLHGMLGSGVIVSDGAGVAVGENSPVARAAEALKAAYPNEAVATCNEYAGADIETLLCGTTNIQGRYLNGSSDVCLEGAPGSTQRFLHMEQSRSIRFNPEPLYDALDRVVPSE